MTIVLFDSIADAYGSSRICRLVLRALRDEGNEVRVFVGEDRLGSECYGREVALPLLVMSYLRARPVRSAASILKKMWTLARSGEAYFGGVRLVYCNTLATLPVAIVAKARGLSTVIHLHETASSTAMALVGRAALALFADRIICVSDAVAKSWRLERHPRNTVIRNGIPDDQATALALERGQTRDLDLCFVGRLSRKKGADVLLDALRHQQPHPEGRPLRVAIAGGPIPGQPVPRAIQEPEPTSAIELIYLGELDQTEEVFRRSRVACVPSRFADPYPTVVLEALRAGCAVIATSLGGAREALEGAAGQLVRPGSDAELFSAIQTQVAGWSNETVARNRACYLQHHTYESFRARLLALDELRSSAAADRKEGGPQ